MPRAQHQAREQPVPFSHAHHVGGLGIDCRYCHTSVETSTFASIPPTKTCMNCHSQIWMHQPDAGAGARQLPRPASRFDWTRVHDLPDFVYFNHSIHVNKGVGCETCHGRVDQMPLMRRRTRCRWNGASTVTAIPEKYVRPREFITTMGYEPAGDQEEIGRQLQKEYHIQRRAAADELFTLATDE